MAAYSMDLRQRVVTACDARDEIARRFSVSTSWIRKLLKQRRDTGSIAPKPHGGGRKSAYDDSGDQRLRAAVEAEPDASLEELREAGGVPCSVAATCRALKRLGLPRKKSRRTPPSRPART